MSKASRRRSLAAVITLGVLAGACGGGDDGGSSSETPSSVGSEEPGRDRVLRVGMDLSAEGGGDFDPAGPSPALIKRSYHEAIYDVMIRTGEGGKLEPGLAESWEVPDPTTLVLHLRPGVEFQDGTPFDAEAVKFSWDRLLAAEDVNPHPEILQIASVEAVDELTVELELDTAVTGGLLTRMQDSTYLGVVSPTAVEELGEEAFRKAPVGAGPFELTDVVPEQRVSMRAWEGYWDEENRLVGGVDFVQSAIGPPALAALAAGDIDVGPIAVSDVAAAEAQGLKTAIDFNGTVTDLHLCDTSPPFDNLELRKAVAYAIDREAINQASFSGLGEPTSGLFAEASPYFLAEEADRYTYDVDRALELRESSGAPEDIDILIMYSNQPRFTAAAQVLQQNLAAIGIDAEIRPSEGILADLEQHRPDAWISAPLPLRGDLTNSFSPGGVVNWCGYEEPELPALLQATQDLTGGEEAVVEAWAEVQRLINEELPLTTITVEPLAMAHSPEVAGVSAIYSTLMGAQIRTIHFTE